MAPPTPAPPAIDVVIPVHGAWRHTERCLEHLAAQTVPHAAIVVDNASPDETRALVAQRFPHVRLVEMGENAGFARAANRGVAAGDGALVVLLNNDVDCAPDFLERLAAPFADAAVGSAAPLLLRPGGERVDALGIVADATLACFVRLQGAPADAAGHDGDAPPLLGPHGAAAAYRRDALEQIGGFDERIFMYGEDLDVALRLRAAGWRASAAPDARAVHAGGATAGKRSAWQRERGGFGRGYLLRRYGVLRGRAAPRALLTEVIVVAGDLAISRDAAALRGRLAGWRAARGLPRRAAPAQARTSGIGFRASLRLRTADYGLTDAGAASGAPSG
jgi:N-acetylglucosaminyl-diphospho-decaprenol L-rhamnosyltransferase